jgi:hypothetical protein
MIVRLSLQGLKARHVTARAGASSASAGPGKCKRAFKACKAVTPCTIHPSWLSPLQRVFRKFVQVADVERVVSKK